MHVCMGRGAAHKVSLEKQAMLRSLQVMVKSTCSVLRAVDLGSKRARV